MPFRSVALESRLVYANQLYWMQKLLNFASISENFPNFKSVKKEIISFSNPFDTFLGETNLFQT